MAFFWPLALVVTAVVQQRQHMHYRPRHALICISFAPGTHSTSDPACAGVSTALSLLPLRILCLC
jgi:hypothetical protein